jgi:hypothetical protein
MPSGELIPAAGHFPIISRQTFRVYGGHGREASRRPLVEMVQFFILKPRSVGGVAMQFTRYANTLVEERRFSAALSA